MYMGDKEGKSTMAVIPLSTLMLFNPGSFFSSPHPFFQPDTLQPSTKGLAHLPQADSLIPENFAPIAETFPKIFNGDLPKPHIKIIGIVVLQGSKRTLWYLHSPSHSNLHSQQRKETCATYWNTNMHIECEF